MDFLKPFEVEAQNCSRIVTGGFLLLSPLICPNNEPVSVLYTLDSDYTAGDEVLNVVHNQTTDEIIREGAIINLAGNTFTVTEKTTIPTGTTATPLPVEPIDQNIATGVPTNFTLASRVLKLLSPTNIPVNMTSQTEDSTDLSQGIKSSEGVVSVASSIQINAFDSLEDEALYRYIFKEADRGGEVFAMTVRSNGVITAGRAIVANYTNDQAVMTFSKLTFNLNFQGQYSNIAPFKFLSAEEKVAANNLRRFMGLSELS